MDTRPFQKVLDAEVNRKEFLLCLGASVLAMTGVAAIVKTLFEESLPQQQREQGAMEAAHTANRTTNEPNGGE